MPTAQRKKTDLLRWIPPATGVYFLILCGEIIYVGRSNSIRDRITAHIANKVIFDDAYSVICDSRCARDLEALLISTIQPRLNTHFIRQAVDAPEGQDPSQEDFSANAADEAVTRGDFDFTIDRGGRILYCFREDRFGRLFPSGGSRRAAQRLLASGRLVADPGRNKLKIRRAGGSERVYAFAPWSSLPNRTGS